MASRKILVQLDIAAASNLTSPLSGFVGFSAKADGLYQKIGTAPELRLLTSADVQNAILADGSITGAVSQAQIFTIGVKLYNLTQGYIPYASGATKLLSNSPIYTNGTNVGIGTTTPGKKLSVGLAAAANGVDGDILSSALATGTGYGSSMIWNMYVAVGNANSILAKIQPSIYQPTRSYLNSLDFFVGDWNNNNDAGTAKMTIQSGGNVGIGTISPTALLHIKGGSATKGTAPIKLTSGVNLTTPESGAIEFSSSRLYFTPSTTRETIAFMSDITAASHAPVTIGAIGSTPNANGMSISGQTLSLQPASALYGGVLTNSAQTIAGNKTFNGNISGSGSNLLTNIIIDTHPESISTIIPFINNDIAYLTLRGGSVTSNYGTPSLNLFDGSPSYAVYNNTDWATTMVGGYIIEATFHKAFTSSNKIGISFGNSYWRSNYIKVEVYRTDTSVWEIVGETSTNSSPIYQTAFNKGGAGITKMRLTFNDFNSFGGSNFRIAQIWLLNYSSIGSKEVFVGRDGGAMYGTLNLNKNILTNIGNVGTNFIASTGGLNLAGLLTSNGGISNPSSYTQSGTSLNTFTGTSTFSNATYSALFTGGNVGIGTPAPNQQLEITQNFRLPSTAGATPYGIIYKDGSRFIHNFNYGNNGTVTTSGNNTFIGINAGNFTMGSTATQNYNSSFNTGIGVNSLFSNTTGNSNTAIGYQSLYFNTTGYNNIGIGYNSLYNNTTGYNNTAIGVNSLFSNTTGYNNTAIGLHSLYSNNTGDSNTAIGVNSLYNNTTGYNNAAIGFQSLFFNISGYNNAAIGLNSLYNNTTGNSNSAIGVYSLIYNTTGFNNTGIGFQSLYLNTTGYDNTAIGVNSLYNNTTGYNNTAIGFNAGSSIANSTARTTGNNGIYLGCDSKANADGTDNEIVIGFNAIGAGSNKTVIGNSSITDTYFGSSTGSSKLWASALNLSGLTASKVVFTDSSKNLTSTGIGTAAQFIKGDGSLDSNTYITTGTTIISGSGVASRITLWNGTTSQTSNANLTFNSVDNLLSTNSIYLAYNFKLGSSTTAGYVLTTDANGNGTWQAPTGGGSYTLPTATASVLGGVKIGSGITISSGVISVSTNYQAPITTGTTAQYFRGDLSLATFPTIHTGNGFNGGVTFWNGANSLSAAGELTWNNISKNLVVTGGLTVNDISSNSMSTNSLSTNGFRLIATTTAGYVLTTDANGNGTWQIPTGSGSYTLPTATASVLGGVKIGSGITISSGVISVSTNYEAPLTFTNGLSRTGNTVSFSGSLSGFVPYTGATMDVDLGSKRLTADNICVTTGSGAGKFLMDVTGQGHAAWSNIPVASSTVTGSIKVGYGLQIDQAVLSVNPSAFVPYTGADRDVNLASYSIYAYDFLIYSDINLKCNIEDIEMKKLDINYKQFEYKTSRGEKRYGVIAQELLSIAPEFVSESNNSYAVKYTDLLIYEVAQLKEEVKQLKSLVCR